MIRYNKTYRNKPTKRIQQQQKNKKTLSIFLLLFFTLATISYIYDNNHKTANQTTPQTTPQATPQATQTTSKELNTFKLISLNPQAEAIAHQASTQACNKHAINQTQTQLDNCILDLMSIFATETGNSFNFEAIGDHGNAHGIAQINRHFNPQITINQAQDPFYAADFTLARMIKYGYKTDRNGAIRKHNGSRTNPLTLVYLNKVNKNKANYQTANNI